MALEKVISYFEKEGLRDRVMVFDQSSATVELAAQAVGCIPARIAKTLSFYTEDGCMLIVAAGDAKIDNSKFKHFFGYKAKMLNAEDVATMTNHAIGGVCPFGVPENAAVYLDKSLQRFDTIFPACGSSNSAIEFTCDELFKYSKSLEWIDVAKLPEVQE